MADPFSPPSESRKRLKRPCTDRLTLPSKSSETPSKLKNIDKNGADKELEAQRKANLADIGDQVPLKSMSEFLDEHVPKLHPDFDLDKIADKLVADGKLVEDGWIDYLDAVQKETDEDKIYKSLEAIVKAIKKACTDVYPDVKSNTTFASIPRTMPKASMLPSTCKPDLYVTTQPVTAKTICWEVIAIPGEEVTPAPRYVERYGESSVKVPYGHIWVESDNARHSLDSNDYGPVSGSVTNSLASNYALSA